MSEPRSVPPTSSDLAAEREQARRKSIAEWIAVARQHITAAKENRR